jgi:hypothetical protein
MLGLPLGRENAAWAIVGANDLARGDKQLAVITPTGRLGERDALRGGLAADQPVYRLIVQSVIVMEKRAGIPQGFDEGFLVANFRSGDVERYHCSIDVAENNSEKELACRFIIAKCLNPEFWNHLGLHV